MSIDLLEDYFALVVLLLSWPFSGVFLVGLLGCELIGFFNQLTAGRVLPKKPKKA